MFFGLGMLFWTCQGGGLDRGGEGGVMHNDAMIGDGWSLLLRAHKGGSGW